ncbi:unnamed protein product [Lota lota]
MHGLNLTRAGPPSEVAVRRDSPCLTACGAGPGKRNVPPCDLPACATPLISRIALSASSSESGGAAGANHLLRRLGQLSLAVRRWLVMDDREEDQQTVGSVSRLCAFGPKPQLMVSGLADWAVAGKDMVLGKKN